MWNGTVSVEFRNRPKLCGICPFPQNLDTKKLSEILVFYEVRVNRNKTFHWYNLSNEALFFCQRWRESKQGILKSSAWKVLFRGQSGVYFVQIQLFHSYFAVIFTVISIVILSKLYYIILSTQLYYRSVQSIDR